jgi:hypothetical protein
MGRRGYPHQQLAREQSDVVACDRNSATRKTSMFFFFSNRLGCLGSIVVSLAATIFLLFLFGILRF